MLYLPHMEDTASQMLTDEELQKSYWFLTHKDRIRRTAALILGIICFFIWSYTIFLATTVVFIPWQNYQNIFVDLKKQYSFFSIRPLAQDIQKDAVSFVQSEEGVYDAYARVKNPNPLWRVYFDVVFTIDGTELPAQHTFLLPDEEKYLIQGGLKRQAQPITTDVAFQNISWKRISKKEKEEMTERTRFTIKDIKIAPISSESGAIAYTKVVFTIVNDTVYRFWDISVPVILKSGDQIIALNTLPLTNLGFDEKRIMESRWYADLSNVTAVDVLPSVDVFDPGAYQGPTVQELEQKSPDIIKQEQELLRLQEEEQQQQLEESTQYY